jgi:protein-L-isoaspartate(D-aspartate) O-methyltransferase
VGPAGRVLTVDVDPDVTGPAARHLAAAGAANVIVVTGDGWAPPAKAADRIVATVGVWDFSPAWVEQLDPDGVLVVPLWLRAGQQASFAFRKAGGRRLQSTSAEPCGFMRMRGPGAGEPTYHKVEGWTVSLDRPSPATVEVLAALLGSASSVREAPRLELGWFTAIALSEADAVHLFTDDAGGPTVSTGILSVAPPGLAVVETRPPAVPRLRTYGSDAPLARLLDLIHQVPAVDPARLVISAVPTGDDVDAAGALATLVRPNYSFVVQMG